MLRTCCLMMDYDNQWNREWSGDRKIDRQKYSQKKSFYLCVKIVGV